jgi:hypothetical protein
MTITSCDRCGAGDANNNPDVHDVEIDVDKNGDIGMLMPNFDLCKKCRTTLEGMVGVWLKNLKH